MKKPQLRDGQLAQCVFISPASSHSIASWNWTPKAKGGWIVFFFSFIEVKLMSNVVLISAVQQSDSVMYTVFIF